MDEIKKCLFGRYEEMVRRMSDGKVDGLGLAFKIAAGAFKDNPFPEADLEAMRGDIRRILGVRVSDDIVPLAK